MFDHFFKEILAEHPEQAIYFSKSEAQESSFIGDTKQCLNVMPKDGGG